MPASVSRRAFIQWLPERPSEPTSTLVLTSPGGHFVDVRLLGSDIEHGELRAAQVDWAFAGTSKSVKADEEVAKHMRAIDTKPYLPFVQRPGYYEGPYNATHSTWTHTISSRTADVEGIVDSGDMLFVAPLGMTLEQGSMLHPETQQMTDYMEGWVDDEIFAPRCVVMKLQDGSHNATGLAVKLDCWIQGVLRVGDAFSLERWQWTEGTGWSLKARLGNAHLPLSALQGETHQAGDTVSVESDGQLWRWEVLENEDVFS